MTPGSPWLRFVGGLLAAVVAIRIAVEIIRPVVPFLIGALALLAVICAVRWWRNRW